MNGASEQAVLALSGLDDNGRVVTVGNFDGVHRGHQHVISLVTSKARELGVRSLVMTFEPHPVAVLRPEHAPRRIATPEEKARLLHCYGINDIVVIPFSREFASLSPEDFLMLVLDHTHPVAMYVGEGFRFGKMRAGDTATIAAFGGGHGFTCHIVEPLSDETGVVSSSRVRDNLARGNVANAAQLLGRRFRMAGIVEQGMARGRDLGYPTANLSVPEGFCVPGDGIYAGYARFDRNVDAPHQALIYIGTSPTFGDRGRLVEVNILDYRGDLYGHELEIEFVAFVRGDRVFDSPRSLMTQMAEDETGTRDILARSVPESGARGN